MHRKAPGQLELVRQFVNTRDIEAGADRLTDATTWTRWASAHDVTGTARASDLAKLRELREALRTALLANHDRAPLPEDARQAMQAALKWSGANPTITECGLGLSGADSGPRGLARQVLLAVSDALRDGTWSRLKACRDDTCQWAFFDHSRSRTGQWCSMEICGNRNKQARWRSKPTDRAV